MAEHFAVRFVQHNVFPPVKEAVAYLAHTFIIISKVKTRSRVSSVVADATYFATVVMADSVPSLKVYHRKMTKRTSFSINDKEILHLLFFFNFCVCLKP